MNILFIGKDHTNYDSKSHEIGVAEIMAKEGNKVTLLVDRMPKFERDKIPKKMRIFPMPLNTGPFIKYFFGIYKRLTEEHLKPIDKIAKKEEFDVIFSSAASGAELVYKLKKRYNCKSSVVQVLDLPVWLLNSRNPKDRFIYRYYWKRWLPYILKADKVVVSNNVTEEDFPRVLKDLKIKYRKIPEIFVVNYGIIIELMNKIPNQKKRNQMIFVSRLVKHKGVDLLIRAAALAKNPPKLVIVGDGNQRKFLEKLAIKKGIDVVFRGALSNRDKIIEIKRSKFSIYTSTTEQIAGLFPIESLYCKTPCICFDIRILRDLYGRFVEYVPKYDVTALANKIDELNSNKAYRKKHEKEGKIFVKNNLTTEIHAKQISKIFKELKYEQK